MKKFPSVQEIEYIKQKMDKGIVSRPLSKNANNVDKTKFKLCEKFVIYKNTYDITQKALAEQIDIDEALVSKILHYHFEEFSTDRLIKYLSKIYPKIELKIDVA